MKVNIQKTAKRLFPFLMVLCIVIGVMVFPASAAEYIDYTDYVTNISVDGDNDLVTVVIPASEATVFYQSSEGWIEGGSFIKFDVVEGNSYNLRLWPLPALLDLSNIPDGTSFSFGFNVNSTAGFSTPTFVVNYDYYAGDAYESLVSLDLGKQTITDTHTISGTIQKPSVLTDGMGASLYIFGLVPLYNGTFTFYAEDFVMTMTISSLYRLQQETGKTNQILQEVEKQLEEQGQTLEEVLSAQEETNEKLDEIINGSDEQNSEADSASNDLADLGDQLSAVEKPDTSDISLSVDSLIPQTAFLAYTAPISSLWENETLVQMLVIVLSLVLLSWIFFGKKG